MKKETLYVAFSTQKGGVGKTTFTVLVASYLYYLKGYNVAVVDCDYPQHSISAMRKRDAEQVNGDDYYKQLAFTSSRHWERKPTRCFAVHRTKRLKRRMNILRLPGWIMMWSFSTCPER